MQEEGLNEVQNLPILTLPDANVGSKTKRSEFHKQGHCFRYSYKYKEEISGHRPQNPPRDPENRRNNQLLEHILTTRRAISIKTNEEKSNPAKKNLRGGKGLPEKAKKSTVQCSSSCT